MRYYEFNNCGGYYALIMAETESRAASLEEDEKEIGPDIVTEEYAKRMFCECLMQQGEEDKTYHEFEKDFDSHKEKNEPITLLIDGSLL
ncbi:MAG: hypothetical protein KH415_21685 [Clostridium sp.]|nr:hypothetical protein [Clostridium sp.]